jgi:poly(3-hydroxybutyrate) depolymerase
MMKPDAEYIPWTDGYAVGFECRQGGKTISYVYLNPSSSDSESAANVFLYHGPNGNPMMDAALTHVLIGAETNDETL